MKKDTDYYSLHQLPIDCFHVGVFVSRPQGDCVSIMPLFGKSHKSPADIVRSLKENLAILVKQDKKTDKVEKDVCVCMSLLMPGCPGA